MDQRRGSEAWKKRTQLAQDIKGMIDITLAHYERKFYEDMVLVVRLDGEQIPLKHERKTAWGKKLPPGDGGSLRIDHEFKVIVKEQSQGVKGVSRMVSDFHDHIP